jgi:hypothetical protein
VITAPMGNLLPGCKSGCPTACTIPGRVCAVVASCVIERESTGAFDVRTSTGQSGLACAIINVSKGTESMGIERKCAQIA